MAEIDFTELWDEFKSNKHFPNHKPFLAHYTSLTTFEQIIRNNELWFSHPFNMNDYNEFRVGLDLGGELFKNHVGIKSAINDDASYKQLQTDFEKQFQHFASEEILNTYIFCSAEIEPEDENGCLSMWRGYGNNGNGVAMIIDTNQFREIPNSPLLIARVEYLSNSAQENKLNQLLDKFSNAIENYQESLNGNEIPKDNIENIAANFLRRLIVFAICTKDDGFIEENEWRIIYMQWQDPCRLFKNFHSYAVTDKGIEIKLKIKMEPIGNLELNLDKFISKVILGPNKSSVMEKAAVIRMLEINGFNNASQHVDSSKIPYRP